MPQRYNFQRRHYIDRLKTKGIILKANPFSRDRVEGGAEGLSPTPRPTHTSSTPNKVAKNFRKILPVRNGQKSQLSLASSRNAFEQVKIYFLAKKKKIGGLSALWSPGAL